MPGRIWAACREPYRAGGIPIGGFPLFTNWLAEIFTIHHTLFVVGYPTAGGGRDPLNRSAGSIDGLAGF